MLEGGCQLGVIMSWGGVEDGVGEEGEGGSKGGIPVYMPVFYKLSVYLRPQVWIRHDGCGGLPWNHHSTRCLIRGRHYVYKLLQSPRSNSPCVANVGSPAEL